MASPESIVKLADSARRNLADMLKDLQDKIDGIKINALNEGRFLIPSEKATRADRRAKKAEIEKALIELTFVTLQALNNSAEVKRLTQKMIAINEQVADDLQDLNQIAEYADAAAKTAKSLENIV